MKASIAKILLLLLLVSLTACGGGGGGLSGGGGSEDTIAPSVPTGLVATANSTSQITLTWNASTDDVGVAGYDVENGIFVTNTSEVLTNLAPSTQYCFSVKARDAAYNYSSSSAQVCASTLNPTGWSPAIQLGERRDSLDYDLYSPRAALNDSNAGIAVWDDSYRYFPYIGRIVANVYRNGSWGTPVIISRDLPSSHTPSLAMNANGNGAAVWSMATSTTTDIGIGASLYTAATNSWSAPVRICDPFTGYFSAPKAAMDSLGNVVAIWLYEGDVWTSRYSGSAWSSPELLSSGTNYVYSAELKIGGDNNAFVVYSEETSPGLSSSNIFARIYTASTATWGTSSTLIGKPTVTTDDAANPVISVYANGDAVVAWEMTHYNGSAYEYSIAANFYSSLLSWQTATNVTASTTAYKEFPAVAIDGTGNAFVGWQENLFPDRQGWMSRYDSGAKTWSPAERFDTDDIYYDISDIAIDVDGNGNALFAYRQGRVHTRWYMTASGWAATAWTPVPSDFDNAPGFSLDVNNTGNALVVTREMVRDYVGTSWTPFANHYTKP